VSISITDRGCGIPQENLEKIFDPYFTTKDHGTGLGLTSVYSIVNRHGGLLRVDSSPEGGATFEMILPAAPDAICKTPSRSAETRPMSQGKPVLVMDDEEMIRSLAGAMLSELGYSPVTSADGAEAVRLYRESLEQNRPFAAAILDMTVPGGMGGKVAAEQIRAMDPDAVLFISSGYGTDSLLDNNGVNLFNGAIKKPYSMSQFARVLDCVEEHQ
jgi:CheY-like chemotaxis protein